ncbi:hypothetical protein [Amycolatopsis sp. NPDC051128]|uniref:hypothetical protein n=1 Tax=Amycolatopsis sp. NPDC051128 TaxID=3155412 RepID=UPI0034337E06
MSTSTILPVACGTGGCTNTGHGISIAVSRPSVYRCLACLDALAPRWVPGVTDTRVYADRNTELGHLDASALREQAAPALSAIGAARDALTMLADLVGPALARDAVTAIVNARDRIIDWSVTNWWAAYRYPNTTPHRTGPRGLPVRSRLAGPRRRPRPRRGRSHRHRLVRPLRVSQPHWIRPAS